MATDKPKENDASLPFAALQLLAPPVRLISAALWKVMKQKDVMQYGVVEEFVTSACETVPGLLTLRHQGKLTLGLRGRLILEMCCKQPEEKLITPHLERICVPANPSQSSAPAVRRDVKIQRTVESFHLLVQTLLKDKSKREQFYKEEFPVEYGPKFDQELEKLLWEFLIRLDQLLPVPNLAKTVSWLCDAPPVLEECARAATQPQLLKMLLQHQTCLGHLETAASLPPNMGDSILASLSLPPSGRVSSNQATEDKKSASGPSYGEQTREKKSFTTPVFGIISNGDVPIMRSANKRTQRSDNIKENLKFTVIKPIQTDDRVSKGGEEVEEERNAARTASGMKRKNPDKSETDEEEEEFGVIRSGKRRISKRLRNGTNKLIQGRVEQMTNEGHEVEGKMVSKEFNTSLLENQLPLPEDQSLSSTSVSCLCTQPRVVLEKLSITCSTNRSSRGAQSSYVEQWNHKRRSPIKASEHKSLGYQPQKPDSEFPGQDNKENHPMFQSMSGSPSQQHNTDTVAHPGHNEDYVADSEDEATKNFKGRLFVRRYYKTKHGTYVPTLREFWKPGMARRDLKFTDGKPQQ